MRAALLAPTGAMLAGCPFSLEQGLFNECRGPAIPQAARALVDAAWDGVRAEQVWDSHAHLFGNGRGGSGAYVEPDLDNPRTPVGKVKRAFFRNAACVGDDDAHLDQAMVARLTALADALPPGAKVMLLAFDFTYDVLGRKRPDLTSFAIPNDYARRVALARPDRFEWIASVHPYREDAIAALEAAAQGGARAIKWLPPSMGIDLSSPRCNPFYDALVRLNLPLLVHVGEEQAVAGAGKGDLANPLYLRHPLDRGARVIAAHCATLGESDDIESGRGPLKSRRMADFELFARLMGERQYEKLLFGDISAITQANRLRHLPALIAHADWHARLLNGSDYPLPGVMPIFSLSAMVSMGLLDAGAVAPLRELRHANALQFDFVLKRNLRNGTARFPARVFETRSFFEAR
jgi:uncharacterized protein